MSAAGDDLGKADGKKPTMNARHLLLAAFATLILAGIRPVLAKVAPSPAPVAAPTVRGEICCHYYVGYGKWENSRMQGKVCTSFPILGDVVDDSNCQSAGCQKK